MKHKIISIFLIFVLLETPSRSQTVQGDFLRALAVVERRGSYFYIQLADTLEQEGLITYLQLSKRVIEHKYLPRRLAKLAMGNESPLLHLLKSYLENDPSILLGMGTPLYDENTFLDELSKRRDLLEIDERKINKLITTAVRYVPDDRKEKFVNLCQICIGFLKNFSVSPGVYLNTIKQAFVCAEMERLTKTIAHQADPKKAEDMRMDLGLLTLEQTSLLLAMKGRELTISDIQQQQSDRLEPVKDYIEDLKTTMPQLAKTNNKYKRLAAETERIKRILREARQRVEEVGKEELADLAEDAAERANRMDEERTLLYLYPVLSDAIKEGKLKDFMKRRGSAMKPMMEERDKYVETHLTLLLMQIRSEPEEKEIAQDIRQTFESANRFFQDILPIKLYNKYFGIGGALERLLAKISKNKIDDLFTMSIFKTPSQMPQAEPYRPRENTSLAAI